MWVCTCVAGDSTGRVLHAGNHKKLKGEEKKRKSDEGGEESENEEKNKTGRQMWRKRRTL